MFNLSVQKTLFLFGISESSTRHIRYPYTNTIHVLSTDRLNTHLFLLYSSDPSNGSDSDCHTTGAERYLLLSQPKEPDSHMYRLWQVRLCGHTWETNTYVRYTCLQTPNNHLEILMFRRLSLSHVFYLGQGHRDDNLPWMSSFRCIWSLIKYI